MISQRADAIEILSLCLMHLLSFQKRLNFPSTTTFKLGMMLERQAEFDLLISAPLRHTLVKFCTDFKIEIVPVALLPGVSAKATEAELREVKEIAEQSFQRSKAGVGLLSSALDGIMMPLVNPMLCQAGEFGVGGPCEGSQLLSCPVRPSVSNQVVSSALGSSREIAYVVLFHRCSA